LIRKYFFENQIHEYLLFHKKFPGPPIAAAPRVALLRDRHILIARSFFVRGLDIRTRQLVVHAASENVEMEIAGTIFGELLREGEARLAIAEDDHSVMKEFPIATGLFNYGKER